jgi:hypothetical protein
MAVVECRLYQRGKRLSVHTDRVCSGLGGALPKEIMICGGWKSVAMVVRYEHASEERDAQLAQALNAFTMGDNVVSLTQDLLGDRARGARDEREVEGEVLDLPPLTSENEEKCSGGETRTHNLAVNSRLLCH